MIDDDTSTADGEPEAAWNRERILRRLEPILEPSEFRALIARLDRADSDESAWAESAWLERVLTAAETLPLPAVPTDVSIRLRTMFPPPAPVRHLTAVLINDSRIERELVGVRGGTDDDGWTLTYHTELGDLLVDLWGNGDSHDIEAQLMSTARAADFSLVITGPSEFAECSDRLGRVAIENVPSGDYLLTIRRPDVEITAWLEVPPE